MSKKYTPNLTVNKTEFVLVAHDNEINEDGFISIDNGIPYTANDIDYAVKNDSLRACYHDIEYIETKFPNVYTNITIYAIETYIDFNSGESTIKIYEIKDDNWVKIGG